MVRAHASIVRWLAIVAVLVIGSAAYSEPIHLACEGEMSAMKSGTIGRLDKNTSCLLC